MLKMVIPLLQHPLMQQNRKFNPFCFPIIYIITTFEFVSSTINLKCAISCVIRLEKIIEICLREEKIEKKDKGKN